MARRTPIWLLSIVVGAISLVGGVLLGANLNVRSRSALTAETASLRTKLADCDARLARSVETTTQQNKTITRLSADLATTRPGIERPSQIGSINVRDAANSAGNTTPATIQPRAPPVETKPDAGPDDPMVCVTRTGSKYHACGCSYLRKSSIPMKLSEAKKRFGPCSRCSPPL